MPITQNIKGPHNWVKVNNFTLQDSKGHYDQLECSKCGIKAKRRNISVVEIDGRHSDKKIKHCNGSYPDKIKIISKKAQSAGPQFSNLKVGSVHEVVDPPEGYENSPSGVWVMGKDQPVKVLSDEFKGV